MSSSTGTSSGNNSHPTEQQQGSTTQTTATSQSGLGQERQEEISRWSPNTSSQGTSAAGGHSTGESTIHSTAATHGSATSDTATSTGNVEAERGRALHALEHGGQPAAESERNAEAVVSGITRDPESAQIASSSGTTAQARRPRRER